jgi:hypothetical protein
MTQVRESSADYRPKRTKSAEISVADEVWVATALLHREHPERGGFTAREIADRASQENITGRLRPGVYVHAAQHCVANRPPNPGRYRMLYADGAARRLYRPGDPYHPDREGSKTVPLRDELPARYASLIDWYNETMAGGHRNASEADPILALRGAGKEIWGDETPDAYVERLRRDWE